jgi:hypothetical protein
MLIELTGIRRIVRPAVEADNLSDAPHGYSIKIATNHENDLKQPNSYPDDPIDDCSYSPTPLGLLDDVLIVATKTEVLARIDEALEEFAADEALGRFLALVEEGGGLPKQLHRAQPMTTPKLGSPGAPHSRPHSHHVFTIF